MIKNIFYTFLIMLILGFVLFVGLIVPDYGKTIVRKIVEFVQWKPVVTRSVLDEVDERITALYRDLAPIEALRNMTMERFKALSFDGDNKGNVNLDPQNIEPTTVLLVSITNDGALIEQGLKDAEILLNLDQQIEDLIRETSDWLTSEVTAQAQPQSTSASEMRRVQQYENLNRDLRVFREISMQEQLNRSTLMENNRVLLQTLKEVQDPPRQIEIIDQLKNNEELLGSRQKNIVDQFEWIRQNIIYNTSNQAAKIKDNMKRLYDQRTTINDRNSSAGRNAEALRNARERSIQNQRTLNERVDDQMRRVRDSQLNRRLNQR